MREHAIERQKERNIKLPDVLHVLNYGRHEEDKDSFDVKHQNWKHSVRGKTVSDIDLRVIFSFYQKLAVITVIRVGERK